MGADEVFARVPREHPRIDCALGPVPRSAKVLSYVIFELLILNSHIARILQAHPELFVTIRSVLAFAALLAHLAKLFEVRRLLLDVREVDEEAREAALPTEALRERLLQFTLLAVR